MEPHRRPRSPGASRAATTTARTARRSTPSSTPTTSTRDATTKPTDREAGLHLDTPLTSHRPSTWWTPHVSRFPAGQGDHVPSSASYSHRITHDVSRRSDVRRRLRASPYACRATDLPLPPVPTRYRADRAGAVVRRHPEPHCGLHRHALGQTDWAALVPDRLGHPPTRPTARTVAHRRRATDLPSQHDYAAGVERDLAAVTARLTLPWSSGVVEDHVNPYHMLVRQMQGRAGFQLLRERDLFS